MSSNHRGWPRGSVVSLHAGRNVVSQMGLSPARGWAVRSEPGLGGGPGADSAWVSKDARVVVLASSSLRDARGARASAAAVRAAAEYVRLRGLDRPADRFGPSIGSHLGAIVRRAHAAVRDTASRDGVAELRGSLLVALIADEEAWIASVGGLHAFVLRGGALAQLTSHDPAQHARGAGRPHTVRTLGGALAPEPETRLDELAPRDVLLFCTDAVVRALGPAGVGAVLRRESSPVETCDELVRAARERGLADDATAVVVRCFALRPQDDEPPLPAA